MSSTRINQQINAPRAIVYRALLDARAVGKWKVPDGMTCHVHAFDAREGCSIRISLTYNTPTGTGKTTAHTDYTYHGRFVKLVPDEQVIEVDEFETTDPMMRGEITITINGMFDQPLIGTVERLSRRPSQTETQAEGALSRLAASGVFSHSPGA
jgi:uncharacterized protein YndB with AHSA1/START domain